MGTEIICRSSSEDREQREAGDPSNTPVRHRLFDNGLWRGLLQFLWHCGVAQRFSVEID